jgi:hypothetical protein
VLQYIENDLKVFNKDNDEELIDTFIVSDRMCAMMGARPDYN